MSARLVVSLAITTTTESTGLSVAAIQSTLAGRRRERRAKGPAQIQAIARTVSRYVTSTHSPVTGVPASRKRIIHGSANRLFQRVSAANLTSF